jgi:ribose transport system substrate-binding protein
MKSKHFKNLFAKSIVVVSSLLLVGGLVGCGGGTAAGGSKKIAVLMSSSANGYNTAVLAGVKDAAKGSGYSITGFDGQFVSNTQFSQIQNVPTQGYAGVIVVPNDGVSLAGAFPLSSDIPVISILNPIGSDIHKMKPQVSGVVQTIAADPALGATKGAEATAEYCKDKNPCKVLIVTGQSNTQLDVTRVNAFKEVLSKHPNIQIVSVVEGKWDRDTSLTAVSNVLQAHKDINAILSQGDQMIDGAEIALQNAGIDESTVFLAGGGGTKDAVAKTRAGKWGWEYVGFPKTAGKVAMQNMIKKLNGESIPTWINYDKLNPDVSSYATPETLAKTPEFKGEWDG